MKLNACVKGARIDGQLAVQAANLGLVNFRLK